MELQRESRAALYVNVGSKCDAIQRDRQAGIYDGAYRVVELAMGLKENSQTK